jgi:hypothetical protein
MQNIELFITAAITMFSLSLLVLSMLGYKKTRNPQMFFLIAVFILFLIKGIIITLSLFFEDITIFDSLVNIWMFDLVILIVLFLVSMKG